MNPSTKIMQHLSLYNCSSFLGNPDSKFRLSRSQVKSSINSPSPQGLFLFKKWRQHFFSKSQVTYVFFQVSKLVSSLRNFCCILYNFCFNCNVLIVIVTFIMPLRVPNVHDAYFIQIENLFVLLE